MTGSCGADVIRANWKPGEFAPLTDRKLLDKAWADGTAASLAGKPATVEAAATDDKKTAAPLPFNLVRLQQYMNKKFKMTARKKRWILRNNYVKNIKRLLITALIAHIFLMNNSAKRRRLSMP